jgi:hypothetical protein
MADKTFVADVLSKLSELEDRVSKLDCATGDAELRSTVCWCATTLRKMMETKDTTARIVSNLQADYEIDYQLHVKRRIEVWTFELSAQCARIR